MSVQVYDLQFADGKHCRCIVMQPAEDPAQDIDGIAGNFQPGYLTGCKRYVPPPPQKLPWKRDGKVWRIGGFELARTDDGFRLSWPGGELVSGDKDAISEAVRNNWYAVLT